MSKQLELLNQIDVFDYDTYDDILAYALCEDNESNRAILLQLGTTETEINNIQGESNDGPVLDLSQVGFRWSEWFQDGRWWLKKPHKCDWCDSSTTEVSYPHMFDAALGGKMCKDCWNHDRVVYKGSYGEDIGEFRAIKESESSE